LQCGSARSAMYIHTETKRDADLADANLKAEHEGLKQLHDQVPLPAPKRLSRACAFEFM
jgi:hypothetical protein